MWKTKKTNLQEFHATFAWCWLLYFYFPLAVYSHCWRVFIKVTKIEGILPHDPQMNRCFWQICFFLLCKVAGKQHIMLQNCLKKIQEFSEMLSFLQQHKYGQFIFRLLKSLKSWFWPKYKYIGVNTTKMLIYILSLFLRIIHRHLVARRNCSGISNVQVAQFWRCNNVSIRERLENSILYFHRLVVWRTENVTLHMWREISPWAITGIIDYIWLITQTTAHEVAPSTSSSIWRPGGAFPETSGRERVALARDAGPRLGQLARLWSKCRE